MAWRTRQAICYATILLVCSGTNPAPAGDVLPGLQAPDYPTATPAIATPTLAAPSAGVAAPPPAPMIPPSSQTSDSLALAPAAATPVSPPAWQATPAPLATPSPLPTPSPLLTPQLEETPQVISSAPPTSDGLSFQLAAPMRPRSDIFARIDYFTWKEFVDSSQILQETGPLVTIGYVREGIHSRFRAELFGGNMNYDGETMDGVPLLSDTGYFGGRFDLDLLIRRPRRAGFVEFFAGLGTRVWQRDLKSGFDEIGRPVISYQEDWWTVYFYGGLGISRALSPTLELYGTARAGATVFTRQRISLWEDYLQPKAGFTGAMEFGLRGKNLALAVRMETMAWRESDTVATYGYDEWWGIYQPESQMSTIGLSLAYTY